MGKPNKEEAILYLKEKARKKYEEILEFEKMSPKEQTKFLFDGTKKSFSKAVVLGSGAYFLGKHAMDTNLETGLSIASAAAAAYLFGNAVNKVKDTALGTIATAWFSQLQKTR